MSTPSEAGAPSSKAAKQGPRWGRWVPLAIVLLLGSAVAWRRLMAPLEVRAQSVSRGDVAVEVFGRGTIESRREVQLGFDMVGRISALLVDEGDRVKLGQVVGHLAPEQYVADVRTASSGVSLARNPRLPDSRLTSIVRSRP